MAGETILIIDDDAKDRALLSETLQQCGYRVTEAANQAEAIRQARTCPPNLMLIDLHLSDTSGYDLLKVLRADPLLAHIPAIAMTGHIFPGEGRTAVALGFAAYFEKTANPDTLPPLIQSVCSG